MHRTICQAVQCPRHPISRIKDSSKVLSKPLSRWCRPSVRLSKLVTKASENTPTTEEASGTDDYQLQHNAKSVARSMLEGKPLLSREREEVEEEEAKERFVGRLIVLVLGVSTSAYFTSDHSLQGALQSKGGAACKMCAVCPRTRSYQALCSANASLLGPTTGH